MIISARLFIVIILAVLALSAPVMAGDRDCRSGCGDHQTIRNNNVFVSDGLSFGDTAKAAAIGAAATALIYCAGRSVVEIWKHGKLTWCGSSDRKDPPPNPGPALSVTPDNLSDKEPIGVRYYSK